MSTFKDERKEEEHALLTDVVGGHDLCLSGWGAAEGGQSYAFWACNPVQSPAVERWVRGRDEFKNIRTKSCPIGVRPIQLAKNDHCHIYVVCPGHPALEG
jgi:hypothetical protein